jgi:hypothetical protein
MSTRVLLVLLVAVLAGCAEGERVVGDSTPPAEPAAGPTLSIAELERDREAWLNREVVVEGTVEPGLAFEFVDEQPYTLNDGSGTIVVITTGAMPAAGSRVEVTGILRAPWQIKGRRYEFVVLERQVRVLP